VRRFCCARVKGGSTGTEPSLPLLPLPPPLLLLLLVELLFRGGLELGPGLEAELGPRPLRCCCWVFAPFAFAGALVFDEVVIFESEAAAAAATAPDAPVEGGGAGPCARAVAPSAPVNCCCGDGAVATWATAPLLSSENSKRLEGSRGTGRSTPGISTSGPVEVKLNMSLDERTSAAENAVAAAAVTDWDEADVSAAEVLVLLLPRRGGDCCEGGCVGTEESACEGTFAGEDMKKCLVAAYPA